MIILKDSKKKKLFIKKVTNEIILIYHYLRPTLNPKFPSYQKFKNLISYDDII